ncbi:MAG: ATP-binding protein [Solirubrobacterales bacterium]
MRRLPIRVRLTAWYVLVLAGVLAALVAFVVTRLRSDLTSEVDRSLRSAAEQIARGYRAEGVAEFYDVSRTVLPGPPEGSGAQILLPSGRVLLDYGGVPGRAPLPDGEQLARALGGAAPILTRSIGGEHLRVLTVPAPRRSRTDALAVAEPLDAVDDAVDRARTLLVLGGAGALVLVGLGGWWIARKALAPVERMTTRADRIGIEDLSERISVPRAEDEVGHLARTLNAMLGRLQRGVESRQRLVADASHELRAPLAAMRSEIEVSLRRDPHTGEGRAALESVLDEVIGMAATVDNLLTLARVDEGRLELLRSRRDLQSIAEGVVRSRQGAARAAGVPLRVDGEPAEAEVDPERVGQVLANLLDNAIRHSPRGAEVRVRTWAGKGRVGFTVTDRGPGIPDTDRERVFGRFSRGDRARGRGGAGLGLSICREIVAAHGGEIRIADPAEAGEAPGAGVSLIVSLPAGTRDGSGS